MEVWLRRAKPSSELGYERRAGRRRTSSGWCTAPGAEPSARAQVCRSEAAACAAQTTNKPAPRPVHSLVIISGSYACPVTHFPTAPPALSAILVQRGSFTFRTGEIEHGPTEVSRRKLGGKPTLVFENSVVLGAGWLVWRG